MRLSQSAPRGRTYLSVCALESRSQPAGIVTASLVNGVLTLTGDDAANVITNLNLGAGTTTITPDATTTIDDLGVAGPGTVNTPVSITGIVTSLKVAMKGGNDSITSDPAAPISLASGIAIDLGDGNNVFNFTTSTKIDLASVSVKAGDGNDTFTIRGGAGLGNQVVGSGSSPSALATAQRRCATPRSPDQRV
ncbi:MAG TPA: hypothetical protein VHR66_01795 [Gemmataceae bacterium]|nr:hypothetical protein [Gemmataceae bacterium]